MDYSKRGIQNKQRELNAYSYKIGRKVSILVLKLVIAALIMGVVCIVAGGVGLFKSVLAGTPTVRISQIVASGEATIVYDAEGNEIDQYVSSDSNRIEVEWDEIAEYLPLAFVAIEDERFYEHNGIDFKGIGRAAYQFFKTKGDEKQGASTITQQLLKNTIFTTWTDENDNLVRMVKRKIQEQYLALEVTKSTDKNELLLRYMNAINLGQNTLGVESASQRYFGKSAIDLTISECAVIACITQNPSWYNPIKYPENNMKRRADCLDKMLALEFISQEQYDEAVADTEDVYERIGYHNTELLETNLGVSSYFSDAVYEQVLKDLVNMGYDTTEAEHMLNSGGLRIYTTQDPRIQEILDEEMANPENFPEKVYWYLNYALTIYDENEEAHNFSKENMTTWFKNQGNKNFNLIFADQDSAYAAIETYKAAMYEDLGIKPTETNFKENVSMTAQPQAAIVIEDQSTGDIVAMVGGRGDKTARRVLNRATNALRSPGSTFKVLASFAPAIDTGMATLATTYNDAEFNYDGGRAVKNWYKDGYRGICSIRYAVQDSLNIIAVKNQTVIGAQLGYDYLKEFGFTTITDGVVIGGVVYSDVNQTLALGGLTYGVSTYEVGAAFAALANSGIYNQPRLYTLITDADGNVIIDNSRNESHRVVEDTTAYLMTSAMHDVITKGTGTTAGFSGMYLAGKSGTSSDTKDAWFVGYSPYYTCSIWTGYDNAIGMSADESKISKKLWRAVMSRIHEGYEDIGFEQPEGLVTERVCSQSGMMPTELCEAFGCVTTELFIKGTEPTEPCDLHYSGMICGYDGLIACELCPFAYAGTKQLPLLEQEALIKGSTQIIEDEATGEVTYIEPILSHYCQHNEEFFANPDYESIIAQQAAEIEARRAQAEATETTE